MDIFLEQNDIQLIRGLLKSQKVGFAFSVYLTLTFAACSIVCLIATITDNGSPMVILLGFGSAALTYFLVRATLKSWKQVIHPLRSALRPGAEKTLVAGKLRSVSLSGKGKVTYEIDGNLITTYPALLHNGLALLQEPLTAIDTLLQHNVSLHLFVMPDGRQLLLDIRHAALQMDKNVSTYRIKSQKRQRTNRKLHVTQEIKGTITEIIKANARIQVMGESMSNNNDTWLRIDGKAYLINSNGPLPPLAVGDPIELEVS